MSPSRSNTICFPSGLTSTFIHVPSDVSNAIVCVGPYGAVTSHFLLSACCSSTGALAEVEARGAATVSARRSNAAIFFIVSRFRLKAEATGTGLFVLEASPQVPAGDGAIRPPGFGDLADAIGLRTLAQAVQPLDRRHDTQVVDRHHVGAMQPEHQEHLGRPPAEALDLHDRVDHVVVGQ